MNPIKTFLSICYEIFQVNDEDDVDTKYTAELWSLKTSEESELFKSISQPLTDNTVFSEIQNIHN